MHSKLFRITLNTAQPDLLLRFYSVLGFQFEQKDIDKGSAAWVGSCGDFTLELFSIKESFLSRSPTVQMSFQVKHLEEKMNEFKALNAQVMVEPMKVRNGTMAVVIDPEGRAVELIQL